MHVYRYDISEREILAHAIFICAALLVFSGSCSVLVDLQRLVDHHWHCVSLREQVPVNVGLTVRIQGCECILTCNLLRPLITILFLLVPFGCIISKIKFLRR